MQGSYDDERRPFKGTVSMSCVCFGGVFSTWHAFRHMGVRLLMSLIYINIDIKHLPIIIDEQGDSMDLWTNTTL